MFAYELIGALFGAFLVSLIIVLSIKIYYLFDDRRLSERKRDRLDALREELQKEFHDYAAFVTRGVAFEITEMRESKAVADTMGEYRNFRERKIKIRYKRKYGLRKYWTKPDAPDDMDHEEKRLEGVMLHVQSLSLAAILPRLPSALARYFGEMEFDELRTRIFAAIERSRWSD